MSVSKTTSWGVIEPGIKKIFMDTWGSDYPISLTFTEEPMFLKVAAYVTYNNNVYSKGFKITREAVTDQQWDGISRQIQSLAKMCRRTMEKQGAKLDGVPELESEGLQGVINKEVNKLKGVI